VYFFSKSNGYEKILSRANQDVFEGLKVVGMHIE
jgi:hypothetical protein